MSVIAIGLLLCCSSSGAAAIMMGGSAKPPLPMGPAPPPLPTGPAPPPLPTGPASPPPPEDCEGQFKPDRTGQIGRKIRWVTTKYVVTSPPGPGGKPCPYKDGQKISIIKRGKYGIGSKRHDYNDAAKCARFIGKGGDATKRKVYRGYYNSRSKLRKLHKTVKSYHKESGNLSWCAVHK